MGAGVAGLSLAIALGRAGIRVTVIDGASRPQTPLMAEQRWDLRRPDAGVRCFLDDLGAWSQIPENRKACHTGMRFGMLRVAAVLTSARDVQIPSLGLLPSHAASDACKSAKSGAVGADWQP